MRTFSQKQIQPQNPVSSSFARSSMATPGPAHREHPILRLQRTIGNQAVQRILQTNAEELKAGLTGTASPRLEHDLSRIPVHPPAAAAIQTKLGINKQEDEHERAVVAPEEMEEMGSAPNFPHAAPGYQFDFTRIPITAPQIQRKPTVSSPGDSIAAPEFTLEREAADRAERVHGEGTPYTTQSGRPLPFLD